MASFMPAGEEDYDEDDFILGNETVDNDDKPRIIGPVKTSNSTNNNRQLFQNGFGSSRPSTAQNGVTSVEDFRAAAMRGHLDVIEACLKKGIKVDEILKCGWTALMYAANCANPDIVHFLLENGADANFNKDFYTVLMAACSSNRNRSESVATCVQTLVKAGAGINVQDRYHVTALMCAAREGHVTVVEYLLGHDAEINRQDSRGWTALSWASSKGRKELVQILLDKGADARLKHIDGQTAVDDAIATHNDEIACMLEGKAFEKKPPLSELSTGSIHSLAPSSASPTRKPPPESPLKPPPPEGDMIPDDKPTDQHYGELEVFLCGLDLGQLIPVFKDQHVDFFNFLRFNEQDLINMGVSQIGIRKKILDAIAIVHKKEWDKSSLISVQYNKHIGCPDAMAMIANISKHLCYIGSTVGYVSDQLRSRPQILADARDGTGPRQIHKHTQDALKNVQALEKEISQLKSQLTREMKRLNLDPPDAILKSRRKWRSWRVARLMMASLTITAVTIAWWKRGSLMSLFLKS